MLDIKSHLLLRYQSLIIAFILFHFRMLSTKDLNNILHNLMCGLKAFYSLLLQTSSLTSRLYSYIPYLYIIKFTIILWNVPTKSHNDYGPDYIYSHLEKSKIYFARCFQIMSGVQKSESFIKYKIMKLIEHLSIICQLQHLYIYNDIPRYWNVNGGSKVHSLCIST